MTSPLQQKIKITGPVVVTANRVGDGAVIYRSAAGEWTTELDEAVVTSDAAQARHLVDAAAADGLRAVDPYIAPVTLTRAICQVLEAQLISFRRLKAKNAGSE